MGLERKRGSSLQNAAEFPETRTKLGCTKGAHFYFNVLEFRQIDARGVPTNFFAVLCLSLQ